MRLTALLFFVAGRILLHAADWPSERGNPQQTGWQHHETALSPTSVKRLQLLWKYRLGTASPSPISTPTILGRVITHRGIKELVFAASDSGALVAVDADLGTLFWTRQLSPSAAARITCQNHPLLSPVITPAPPPPVGVRADEENADPTQGYRPLYALSPNGSVHTISPITGLDLTSPIKLMPSNLTPNGMSLFANLLYAVTTVTCEGTERKVWAIPLRAGAVAASWPARTITIGAGGTVYLTDVGAILRERNSKLEQLYSLEHDQLAGTPAVFFTWRGRELLAALRQNGRPLLLDTIRLGANSQSNENFESDPQAAGLATWETPEGARWIYVAAGRMRAYRLERKGEALTLKPMWVSEPINATTAPVIGNGVVYTLSGNRKTILYAVDAATGQILYSSGSAVTADAHSGLALANGHICFGGSNQTIYCFGLPFDP